MATDQRLKRGDVVLVEIPLSDGHEQHGLRPAILVTGPIRGLVTAIPLTTNQEALNFPSALEISPSKSNGLAYPSVALIYQIRAIDRKRCRTKLGRLSRSDVASLLKELKSYLGL